MSIETDGPYGLLVNNKKFYKKKGLESLKKDGLPPDTLARIKE